MERRELWRVLIVEDDPAVARLHRRIVERAGCFRVTGIVGSGEAALRAADCAKPHLILLDIGIRGLDGVEVLRRLRFAREPVEVIAVTAARATDTVRDVVHLGAVDYLVKPFHPQRLQQALGAFVHRTGGYRGATLDQPAVDEVCASGRPARRWLPRGLAQQTLDEIRASVFAAPHPLGADEVAAASSVARVTARRYLEYMETAGEVWSECQSNGPGRPRRLYWRREAPGESRRRVNWPSA